ncbi:MAG: nidogen [Alphaproteobacteria bacterium]|nr:MAG: nidogen [Alphaproteobacteria bacterium]
MKKINRLLLGSLIAFAGMITPTYAIPLLTDGLGGFGELAMLPNDDGSSNELTLPFEINFFGMTHTEFYINNNGNITFNAPVSSFTPTAFPVSDQPMIAPFWGDVDTRCDTCGAVYVNAPNSETMVITWNDVGFFSRDSSLTNNFQLVLRDQGVGNFDVEFRYDRLEWTTGDASDGEGGLGGTQAQAGYDAGDGTNFFALPGSFSADVLNLANTSNVSTETPGLWSFSIREGALPGETADNPLLPVVTEAGFSFDFNVNLNEMIFIDPDIAVGYEYIIQSGPNFASVLLPTIVGDDGFFDIFGYNLATMDYDILLAGDWAAGAEFFFGGDGVNRFLVLGIDEAAMLDPDNTVAFVTGLTFVDAGNISMLQVPVVINTDDPTQVPTPPAFLLILFGLGLMLRRRHFI